MADDREFHVARLDEVAATMRALGDRGLVDALGAASTAIVSCVARGSTVIFMGNGGSASDAAHLAAELVGRYAAERWGLPAICLSDSSAIVTALANDYGYAEVFSRQVRALARPGDVVVAMSTSGRSANVIEGLRAARDLGLTTVGMSGGSGGDMAALCDVLLLSPSMVTARIQECHKVWGHIIAEDVDRAWADSNGEGRS